MGELTDQLFAEAFGLSELTETEKELFKEQQEIGDSLRFVFSVAKDNILGYFAREIAGEKEEVISWNLIDFVEFIKFTERSSNIRGALSENEFRSILTWAGYRFSTVGGLFINAFRNTIKGYCRKLNRPECVFLMKLLDLAN